MLFSSFRFRPRPWLLSLSFGFAGVAAATAQGPRERPRYVLQAIDLDHDGRLSPAEIQAAPASLRVLDRNGDGALAPDELEAPRTDAGASPDQLVTQLMAFDRNGDGFLTPEELPERMRSLFTRGDRNQDGKLTPEEIRQMAARTGPPNGRAAGPGTATGMMRLDAVLNALDTDHDGVLSAAEIGAASASLLALDLDRDGTIEPQEMRVRQQTAAERAAHMLDEWDTNKDGRLSQEEVPDGLRARFAQIDQNKDGFLDSDELQQMFSANQQPMRGGTGGPPPGLTTQPKGQDR